MADDEKSYNIRVGVDSDEAIRDVKEASDAMADLGDSAEDAGVDFEEMSSGAREKLEQLKQATKETGDESEQTSGKVGGMGRAMAGLRENVAALLNPYTLAASAVAGFVVAIKGYVQEIEEAKQRSRDLAAEGISMVRLSYDDLRQEQDRVITSTAELLAMQGQQISAADREIIALQSKTAQTTALAQAQRDATIAQIELLEAQGEITAAEAEAQIAGVDASGKASDREAYLAALREELELREKIAATATQAATDINEDAYNARRRAGQAENDPSSLAPEAKEQLNLARSDERRVIRNAVADNQTTEEEAEIIKEATAERERRDQEYVDAQKRAVKALQDRADALEAQRDAAVAAARVEIDKTNDLRTKIEGEETVGNQIFGLQTQADATRRAARNTTAEDDAQSAAEISLAQRGRNIAGSIDDGRGTGTVSGALAGSINRASDALDTDGQTSAEFAELTRVLDQVLSNRSRNDDALVAEIQNLKALAQKASADSEKALSQIKNSRPTSRR